MKIALASARIIDRDVEYNLAQMKRYMLEAKENGADLVCFGEAYLQGFNALSWQYEEDKTFALSTASETFRRIKRMTKEIGMDLLFGYNELEEEVIYSSCALIGNGEIIQNYRRISKGWKEYSKTDGHYREGDIVQVFEYRERKCVVALCGDLWEFPERFKLDADLLIWPVYVSWTKEEWENGGKLEYAQQAQQCCRNTAYVNSICCGDAFGGAALFLDGRIQAEFPIENEGILYIEV